MIPPLRQVHQPAVPAGSLEQGARQRAGAEGTLLALAWSSQGDEAAMRQALEQGYRLTGNFRGRERDLLGRATDPPRDTALSE